MAETKIEYGGKRIRISDAIYIEGSDVDFGGYSLTNINGITTSGDVSIGGSTSIAGSLSVIGSSSLGSTTINGTLDMAIHRIINLAYPINDQDAANKVYVDNAIASKRYYTTVTIPTTSPYQVDIVHNLNDPAPTYVVYDDTTGEQIEPQNAIVVDNNTLRLEFGSEDAGKTIRVKVIV